MIQRFTCTQLIIAGTTFASGIVLGMLFLPGQKRKNKKPVTNHVTEIADWVDKRGRETIAQKATRIQHLQDNVQQRINYHVPNLYEATKHIYLSGPDVASA